jgi:hypothetical protein
LIDGQVFFVSVAFVSVDVNFVVVFLFLFFEIEIGIRAEITLRSSG